MSDDEAHDGAGHHPSAAHPHEQPAEHPRPEHPPHEHPHGHEHPHQHEHPHPDQPATGVRARLRHALVPHSHDPHEAIQSAGESSEQGIRAAWIGLAGMGVTAVLQLVIVAVSGSIALLADTVHNVGHAATTIPLVIAFKLGQRAASTRYSYGYRRAEDLVGLLISLVIAISAGVIIWESVDALVNPYELTNLWWVVAAGLVGAAGNELVAVYRIRTGRRIGSAALVAEGQHARADGLTSVAVVVGVVGVWMGFPQADAVVGFLIAAVILWILARSLRTTLRRLMDGVDDGVIERMTGVIASAPGVLGVGRVRARWSGHRLEADAEVAVDSRLTVLQSHAVAEEVEHRVLHEIPNVEHVVVHINPVVEGTDMSDLHELTGHHASAQARREYRRRRRVSA